MPKVTRYFSNKRLVYYRPFDPIDWDAHWAEHISMSLFPGKVWGFGMLPFLPEVLPRQGKILEAGCGMGQIVHKLRLLGFDCEGVDSAALTIARIRELLPDLPVSVGDVLRLEVPDGYYSGYISLGVIEHREEGPEPFLEEAWRVLKPGGTAVFTVPFLNPLRRFKARFGCFSSAPKADEVFYQYAFTCEELESLLRGQGFSIIDRTYYDPWKGLKDELPPCAAINKKPKLAAKCRNWAGRQQWLYPLAAHMLALICRKEEKSSIFQQP